MAQKNNTVAIFDRDNTLLNSEMKLKSDVTEAMHRLGVNISQEQIMGDWYKLVKSKGLNKKDFDREFNKRKSWEESIKDGEVKMFSKAMDCLEILYENNILMGLITRSIPEYTQIKIEQFNLEKYFQGNIAITPVKSTNGKIKEAESLVKKLNPTKIEKIYFIGDKKEDVEIAKPIGREYKLSSKGIYIKRKESQPFLRGYTSIKSLDELPQIILS